MIGCAGIITAVVGAVAFFVLSPSGDGPDLSKIATCLPEAVAEARASNAALKRGLGNVDVYLDVSGGMAGYAASRPNAIGNLVSITRNYTRSSLYPEGEKGVVTFHKFGEYRFNPAKPVAPTIVDDLVPVTRPDAYTEQDTNITDLLAWVRHKRTTGATPLSIIVTDLMLDDKEAADQFETSVGGALRNMIIKDDLALGILAVRVPFSGKIYVDAVTIKANLADRPLVIMLIGSPYQVRTFYEYVGTTEAAPFAADTPHSSRAFSLFGLEAGSIVLSEPSAEGVSRAFSAMPSKMRIPGAEGIPSVRFKASVKERDAKAGMLLQLDANGGVADFEVIGNTPVYSGSVWKLDKANLTPQGCKSGLAWLNVGGLPPSGWKVDGQKVAYHLTADEMKQAGFADKGVYMIEVVAGQQGVVKDHPAAAWMQDWSMTNDQMIAQLTSGRATRVGVPGLDPLRRILLAELTMPGSQKIKRAATHLIIETEK